MLKFIEKNILENTDITKTSNFKSWFGKSKIVDKSGKPLVVYHGSNSKFSSFDMSKIGSQTDVGIFGKGFYFSTIESTSKVYGEVRNFYLSIQNPFIIDKSKSIKDVAEYLNLDEDMFTESNGVVKPLLNYVNIFTSQVKDNHDGVIIDRGIPMKEIVAFYPNQIKSATENNGNFSKSSTNIYESSLEEAILDSNIILSKPLLVEKSGSTLETSDEKFQKVFYDCWYKNKPNLPTVKNFPVGLNLENREITFIGVDFIQIVAGGDWQEMIPFSFYVNKSGNPVIYNLYEAIMSQNEPTISKYLKDIESKFSEDLCEDVESSKNYSLEEATLDSNYIKWKKNNVTYRGMKKLGGDNEVFGSFGKGLYTVPLGNKSMAKTYGDLYFVVNAIPKKPKIVCSLNEAEIFRQDIIMAFCKKNNESYSPSFFESKTSIDKEALKLGFDGLIIKGREIVNYTPKNIKYFKNEQDLINYYNTINENTTNKQQSLQESRKLLDVKVVYNASSNCFNLTTNNTTKYFFGSPEEFAKLLKNYKAKDSLTKPLSTRQVTYKQMVDDILTGKDNKVVMWDYSWKNIPHRANITGGY